MPFPPTYPYPIFLNALGDRLHPGATVYGSAIGLRGGGGLWRVGTPIGYPSVLYLFGVTEPHVFIKLDAFIAQQMRLVHLSPLFSFQDFRPWYSKFEAAGVWVTSTIEPYSRVTTLRAVTPWLPSDRNTMEVLYVQCTMSTYEQNMVLRLLYDEMRAALDAHEVDKFKRFRVQLPDRFYRDEVMNRPLYDDVHDALQYATSTTSWQPIKRRWLL